MATIGRMQLLEIVSIDTSGAHLRFNDTTALLPKRQMHAEMHIGQKIEVFIYHGRHERLMATVDEPFAQLGEFALLRASKTNQYGAFMDWGLDKELLVPFAEQAEPMQQDRFYVVRVCSDDRGRLYGSTKVERYLDTDDVRLRVGEEVQLFIWNITELGAKTIINNRYAGLLYRDELTAEIKRGSRVTGYIKRLRDDFLVDVTLRKVGKAGRDDARQTLLSALRQQKQLPIGDKSDPAEIDRVLGMSKKAFKRAAGTLYKDGLVTIGDNNIALKQK